MPAPIDWPIAVLRPGKITRHIAPRTTAGVVSASGFTQRVSVPAHAWTIQYAGIVIATAEQLRVWDAVAGQLDGGANPVYVHLIEDNGGAVNGSVAGGWLAGAVTLNLARSIPVEAGHHFSVGDHLYRAIGVAVLSETNYSVTIRPPLRAALAGGETAYFITPVCKCRLASDDEMTLELDQARMGTATVKFVEDPVP